MQVELGDFTGAPSRRIEVVGLHGGNVGFLWENTRIGNFLYFVRNKTSYFMASVGARENSLTAFLRYGPVMLKRPLTRGEFIALSAPFPDLLMEREADGRFTVMTPVKKGSGNHHHA
jgi:hypothetical protein